MDEIDKENLKVTLDALIEQVVKLNSLEGFEDSDLVDTLFTLQESTFILSGIVYSNGIPMLADHEHDEDGNCIIEDDDD